ncbi:MAG: efflux RND transporter permease subunit [Gammaproteobacteria bacterium]|nr:efflux RND transporter permease subunit [Gammaproteobacteria bacterium]
MIRALLENDRLLSLLVALIIVSGLGALYSLPVAEDPRMVNRHGLILTPFPGARAERVEALVTEKLELKLRELPEIEKITSNSGNGLSSISITLADEVTKPALIWSRARDLINEVQPELPQGTLPSRFLDDRGYAYTLLIALRSAPGELVDRQILQRYARELQSQLRALPGTDIVEIDGEVEEEILVSVDAAEAITAGQTVVSIAAALRQFDTKGAAGVVNNRFNRMQVEISGELDSVERVARIPISGRGEGQVLRIADIASVERRIRTPDSEKSLRAGTEQLVVAVRMLPKVQISRWHARVSEALQEFSLQIPEAVVTEVIFDQQEYTQARMQHLVENIAIGFVLILLILLLTLGWRSALLVAAALPLMALFTFFLMNITGVPIHQMSVTGLVVALGITVDNAIVMVDDINQRRSRGENSLTAVRGALAHLWLPLFGSTTTTILAFMPIVLMPGAAGEFVGPLAICVIFSLIGSYLISTTVVAAIAGKLPQYARDTGFWQTGVRVPALNQLFERCLRRALQSPRRSIALITLLPVLGFYGITTVPDSFFPPVDRDMFSIEVTLPTRTSFSGTEALVRQIDTALLSKPAVSSVDWFIGKSAAPFYYNLIEKRFAAQNYAQAMVKSTSADSTAVLVRELQAELPSKFPQAHIVVKKLNQGPPVYEPVQVRIYGPDLAVLEQLGEELRLVLSGLPNVTSSVSSLGQTIPLVSFSLREEIIAATDFTPRDWTENLRASLDGVIAGTLLEGTEEVPVRVRLSSGERSSPQDLQSLYVIMQGSGAGDSLQATPMQAIADMQILPSIVSIPHYNGRRVNTVGAHVRSGVLPDTVLQDLRAALQQTGFEVPAGYAIAFGGEQEERAEAINSLAARIPLILVLLVVVLVLSFNSWRLFGLIMFVALLSVGLGMLSLAVSGWSFGFQVIIALLGLMGLAINGAIVILAELRANSAALKGEHAGIVAAVMHCTRHITSTTITTVAGFTPLLIGGGMFWPPFATVIVGGTALVTLLSFFLVPAAFLLMTRSKPFAVTLPGSTVAPRGITAQGNPVGASS